LLRSSDSSEDAQDKYAFAEDNFKPLYYIRSYPTDKLKVEMSFDLTHYQPQVSLHLYPENVFNVHLSEQFKGISSDGMDSSHKREMPPLSGHVFQTIFLNKATSENLWTRSEISEDKVIAEKWWKQQSHR
jgi:hypothetical protein